MLMSLPLVICAATFGGSACAFLPRIAHRLAVQAGAPPRSACAHCAAAFEAGPAGWVRAGSACGCQPVPWRTVAAGAVAGVLGPVVLLPAVVLGVLLGLIDLRCLRLPDRLVAGLAVLTVGPLAVLGTPGQIVRGTVGGAVSLVAYAMIALLPRGGLGFGDVKLAAVLGFVLGFAGWPALAIGLLAPHLINGPIAVFLLLTRRAGRSSALPFGPALLAGALVGLYV
jgi:leader peptidase (prepilin peptidase)/N-methyltransferase